LTKTEEEASCSSVFSVVATACFYQIFPTHRQTKKVVLPRSQNWESATVLHKHICIGIQTSGPMRLLMSCEGSSAMRKDRRNKVLPKLKRVSCLNDFNAKLNLLVVIRGQREVFQEIICIGLGEIAPVEVEGKEHDECPYHDAPINLPNEMLRCTKWDGHDEKISGESQRRLARDAPSPRELSTSHWGRNGACSHTQGAVDTFPGTLDRRRLQEPWR